MATVCTHCSRTNSADARYCYHDGATLLGSASPALATYKSFLTPFVFSSGVICRDFDEFAHGCDRHWDAAVEMLQQGSFQQFFNGLGRMDLAQLAREAANFPDRDRALDQFLARLPSSLPAPKLDVQPKLTNLGTLTIGQNSQLELTLENHGARLVYGSISSDTPWLAVSDSGEARVFQFRDSLTIPIKVKGEHLRASIKPIEGDVLVESNAGTFKVKVIANVPIAAFPDGCLAGARTPRELAEKAKADPAGAGPLFASGAVACWYQANGWTYPVIGPASTGLGAVQQFFEALGVSRPPRVFVTQPNVQLKGAPGTKLSHQVLLRSEENRPVYAHAVSAAPWCVAKAGQPQGAFVALPLEIMVPSQAGTTLHTYIRVTANGQQRFDIPVQVTAEATPMPAVAPAGVAKSPAPAPPSPPAPIALASEPAPATQRAANGLARTAAHLTPLFVLGFVFLGLIGRDFMSDAPRREVAIDEGPSEDFKTPRATPADFKVAIQDEPDEGPVFQPVARHVVKDEPEERIGPAPVAKVNVDIKDEPAENQGAGPVVAIAANPLVSYAMTEPPNRFGISTTSWAGTAGNKLLTYSRVGDTNSTVVSVDAARAEFGSFAGQWLRKRQPIAGVPTTAGAVSATHSTWVWNKVAYHQVLEVVPGQPVLSNGVLRRHLDTVLVRWIIDNTDSKPRSAGLRMELDTLIGRNDGVPFTVPGSTRLVNSTADFKFAREVPDFVQALERADIANPGTVAHLTLKPGGGVEPAGRVSLTHWSGAGGFGGRQSLAWSIPIRDLTGDSSVVLYWPETSLKPGERRTIGFAYGLGNVVSNDKLGVTIGGEFEPGQAFTVTAYVENPVAGQTLRLEVPDGLRRSDGAEVQNVALGNGGARNTSIVTWKVLVERTGEFKLKVVSSTGLTQVKTISIARGNAPAGGKLSLDLQGMIEPGKVFTVVGNVQDPVANQTLTLHLPPGLDKVAGADVQVVPLPPAGSKESSVQWQVRVTAPGKYPVRVASSTGVAQTKTITIVQPTRAEGAFQILLSGDFTPGKAFSVSTRVAAPVPDQKLTLVLPTGLQRIEGDETQAALPDRPLTWKVKVTGSGKFTVGVKATTGVTQRKTVVIEPPGDQPGRFDFELADTRDLRPGREFKVIARVASPARDQTLTLVLPRELELTRGVAMQTIEGTLPLTWTVRVNERGKLPIRVESSTGLVRTKTMTLDEPNSTLFGR